MSCRQESERLVTLSLGTIRHNTALENIILQATITHTVKNISFKEEPSNALPQHQLKSEPFLSMNVMLLGLASEKTFLSLLLCRL